MNWKQDNALEQAIRPSFHIVARIDRQVCIAPFTKFHQHRITPQSIKRNPLVSPERNIPSRRNLGKGAPPFATHIPFFLFVARTEAQRARWWWNLPFSFFVMEWKLFAVNKATKAQGCIVLEIEEASLMAVDPVCACVQRQTQPLEAPLPHTHDYNIYRFSRIYIGIQSARARDTHVCAGCGATMASSDAN